MRPDDSIGSGNDDGWQMRLVPVCAFSAFLFSLVTVKAWHHELTGCCHSVTNGTGSGKQLFSF